MTQALAFWRTLQARRYCPFDWEYMYSLNTTMDTSVLVLFPEARSCPFITRNIERMNEAYFKRDEDLFWNAFNDIESTIRIRNRTTP